MIRLFLLLLRPQLSEWDESQALVYAYMKKWRGMAEIGYSSLFFVGKLSMQIPLMNSFPRFSVFLDFLHTASWLCRPT